MQDTETLRMIADYMENGFLENIIDMFKHDRGLYALLPALMSDERSRVRIGMVALVEDLGDAHRDDIIMLIPRIAPLLEHENFTIRADAVYLLEVIGHKNAIPYLERAKEDSPEPVRQLIEEAVEELSKAP